MLNIYEKINEIRKEIGYIQKDKSVSTGGGSYKAVTHDAVTAILREHLNKQNIICIPNLVTSKLHPKTEGAKQFLYEATYSFEFVNAEAPVEKITITIEAHAMDNADKAPGKAISYAKKYAVLKLFEIETGEDEESRYNDSPFDIEYYASLIKSSKNQTELKATFTEAFRAAEASKDKDATKALIKVKDDRKATLEKAAKSEVKVAE